MPGNYCASCHVAADPAPSRLGEWQARPPDEAPCPAVQAYREELLYTGQLLTATERAGVSAGGRAMTQQEKRLAAFRQGAEALQQAPVTSLDAFTAQAQTVRFQGNKVHAAFNQAIDAGKRNRVLFFAALVTLIVLGSLAWGLRNTLKLRPAARAWWREWRPGWGAAAAVGLIFVLFALPLFRVPAAAVETPSAEEQAVQTTLDASGRVADTADRALARAWMLARVGAAWAQLNPARGQAALDAALTAAGRGPGVCRCAVGPGPGRAGGRDRLDPAGARKGGAAGRAIGGGARRGLGPAPDRGRVGRGGQGAGRRDHGGGAGVGRAESHRLRSGGSGRHRRRVAPH